MKNEFITAFKELDASTRIAFSQYIHFFHAPEKAVLTTFEQVVLAIKDAKATDALLKFDYDNTHNKLSDLYKWLIDYWTIQEVKSQSYEAQFFTLEALRKRETKSLLTKQTKLLKDKLKAQPSPDIGSTLMKLRLAHADYFLSDIDPLHDYQPEIQYLLDELDNFYISTKLKYLTEVESRASILLENYTPRLLNEVQYLAKTDDSLHPNIKNLYLPLLKLIKDDSKSAYDELKKFLVNDLLHDRSEKLNVLMYLFNFVAARIHEGDKSYYQESFELAEIGDRQSLFKAAVFFPTATFINIVNTACYLKESVWADAFIKKWAGSLSLEDKTIAKNLASARVKFENDDFKDALILLRKIIKHQNTHFALHIRILLARASFDDKEEVSLQESECKAFDVFIRRSAKMKPEVKNSVRDFLKILGYLIHKKKSKDQILKALEAKGNAIVAYEWLKQKTDAYKRNA